MTRTRPRNQQYDGPFIVSKAGRGHAVIGPWGLVREGLLRHPAGDLCIWLNRSWENGYQQGLADVQLLIDPTVARPLPTLEPVIHNMQRKSYEQK